MQDTLQIAALHAETVLTVRRHVCHQPNLIKTMPLQGEQPCQHGRKPRTYPAQVQGQV